MQARSVRVDWLLPVVTCGIGPDGPGRLVYGVITGSVRLQADRCEDSMNTSHRLIIATVVLAGFTAGLAAQGPDWPQWRGPRRDGTLTAFTEPKAWPDTLTQRWKITVGE